MKDSDLLEQKLKMQSSILWYSVADLPSIPDISYLPYLDEIEKELKELKNMIAKEDKRTIFTPKYDFP